MATITLKINERSKAGKNFMLFLNQFIKSNGKDVEIMNEPNAETIKAMEDVKKGNTEELTLTTFREQLY